VGGEGLVSDPSGQAPTAADDRPIDPTPVHTEDLPATPLRDRNIPVDAWIEAPARVRASGEGVDPPGPLYKRRIGRWLLWRAGPARRGHSRYVAVDAEDLERVLEFRLFPDGTGSGTGPGGARHDRFRTWKEDLRDH
jgi:hypothetical protein